MRRIIGAILAVALFACAHVNPALTPIPAPANAVAAWGYALVCSGMQPTDSLPLKRVKWYTRAHPIVFSDGSVALAYFMMPDTIVFDETIVQEKWIVEHELLHYLRRDVGSYHDPEVFEKRCKVMLWQHDTL